MTKEAFEIYKDHYMKNLGRQDGNLTTNVIIPAMEDYANQKAEPLIKCLNDLKEKYHMNKFITEPIIEALKQYNQ